jgi:hypothetical protein
MEFCSRHTALWPRVYSAWKRPGGSYKRIPKHAVRGCIRQYMSVRARFAVATKTKVQSTSGRVSVLRNPFRTKGPRRHGSPTHSRLDPRRRSSSSPGRVFCWLPVMVGFSAFPPHPSQIHRLDCNSANCAGRAAVL